MSDFKTKYTGTNIYECYYYYYSGKISDIVRTLCFAGFGLIWLLSGNTLSKIWEFKGAIIFLILALVFDLLHYIIATTIYKEYIDKNNLEQDEQGDLEKRIVEVANNDIEFINFFFWGKIFLTFVGFLIIVFQIL